MKILFIVPIYLKDEQEVDRIQFIGGGGRYPLELARALADNSKDEVEILFFGNTDISKVSKNLKITLVKGVNFFQRFNGPSNPIPVSPLFFRKIKEADIIHGYQIRTEAVLIASLYARVINKPFVITDTNFNGLSLSRIIKPEKLANAVLAISQEDYDSWNAKKKFIIYGGVFKEAFPYQKIKKNYVLYFGRILSHKGVDVVVNAITKEQKLIVAGSALDKEYLIYLKKIAKGKHVEFIENPSDKKMVQLYRDASCFVLPATLKDYLGKTWGRPGLYALVVPEAMSCGTPVLVSNVGSLPDFIEKGDKINGYVFEDRNIKDLQAKISSILKNKKMLSKMSINARKLVEEKYDWHVIAKKVRKIYTTFL